MERTDCLGHMTTIIINYSTVSGPMWCTVSLHVPLPVHLIKLALMLITTRTSARAKGKSVKSSQVTALNERDLSLTCTGST